MLSAQFYIKHGVKKVEIRQFFFSICFGENSPNLGGSLDLEAAWYVDIIFFCLKAMYINSLWPKLEKNCMVGTHLNCHFYEGLKIRALGSDGSKNGLEPIFFMFFCSHLRVLQKDPKMISGHCHGAWQMPFKNSLHRARADFQVAADGPNSPIWAEVIFWLKAHP